MVWFRLNSPRFESCPSFTVFLTALLSPFSWSIPALALSRCLGWGPAFRFMLILPVLSQGIMCKTALEALCCCVRWREAGRTWCDASTPPALHTCWDVPMHFHHYQQEVLVQARAETTPDVLESKWLCLLWLTQVHAYIISSLKKEMPSVFGKENKKKELIASLGDIYKRIEREHQISPGDFPNLKKMQVI